MVDLQNLAIPAVINPANTRCICIQIPDEETWITNFVNLLSIPTFWFNWQRTGDNTGKQLADVWFDLFVAIDWSVMSCCCDQPPAIYRVNSDGVFQRSTDGGVTWVNAPEYDYRNTSTIFPPPSAMGFDNTKCQNADSAVVVLNEDVIQGLDNGSAVQALLEFIAAVLIFYLSAGTLAEVSIFLFSGVAAIFGYGVAATKAAFTSTVLDQLRCSIFNAMDSDDSIGQAGITALLVDINTNYTGIIKTSLYALISAAGANGITNMIRANRGSATADCSGCMPPAGCDISDWVIWSGYGTIDTGTRTPTFVEITAPNVGGQYHVIFISSSPSECCDIDVAADGSGMVYVSSGAASSSSYCPCGSDNTIFDTNWITLGFGLSNMNGIHYGSLTPFTLTIDTTRP